MYTERRDNILQILRENRTGSTTNLAEQLNVSEMTIRRDLRQMEREGVVKRYFGGVKLVDDGLRNHAVSIRQANMPVAKRAIAQTAASFVHDGDTILLDTGTTIRELARNLSERPIYIMTSSVLLFSDISRDARATMYLSGGKYDPEFQGLVGSHAEDFYKSTNADYAFISSAGIDLTCGITDYTEEEASMTRVLTEHARTIILLMDSTKFGVIKTFKALDAAKADIVITDREPEQTYIDFFKENGTRLIVTD